MARPTSPYSTPKFGWRTPEERDKDYWTEFCSMLSTMEGTVYAATVCAWSGANVYNHVQSTSASWVTCAWSGANTYITVQGNSASWVGGPTDWPHWGQTEISYDTGWFQPTTDEDSTGRIAHSVGAEPDLAFMWTKGWSGNGNFIMTSNMGMNYGDDGYGIIELNSTNVTVKGLSPRMKFYYRGGPGGASPGAGDQYCYSPDVRVLCLTKTADYNSTWLAVPNLNTRTVLAHGLAAIPDLYVLEFSNTNDGTGEHGYVMTGTQDYGTGATPNICNVTAAAITVSFPPTNVVSFTNYAGSAFDKNDKSGWWYRVKAWNWTPDYNSGWFAIGTTIFQKQLQHNLGQVPFLYLLECRETGSTDVVPMMALPQVNGVDDHGARVFKIGDNMVNVAFEVATGKLATYVDEDGNLINITAGDLRLKLWLGTT